MTLWAMAIDLSACTGCGACIVACRRENNVPAVGAQGHAQGRGLDWIQMITQVEGEYGNLRALHYPLMCLQCDDPPCVKVCPVGATYRDQEGIVGQIYARCIGCRYCTNACPYSVKTFNWFEPEWPAGTDRRLNPDVWPRPVGVVEKCTFCHHRRQKAREQARMQGKEADEGAFLPACVEACPAGAMVFGDLDDRKSRVSRLARDPRAWRPLEELGTRPKVYYLRRGGGG
jgi:molybdopterin-containing oxidoreductase family iron-sulfur binding subunit